MSIGKKTYEGFSLVEMILTIFILGVVMLISSTTLNTLIKVSTISESKHSTRSDVNFILEIVNRTISNASLTDIEIYNSKGFRTYNPSTNTFSALNPSSIYTPIDNNGTEIHVLSSGFNRWICIGMFKDSSSDNWYIVKTSVLTRVDAASCFVNNNPYTMILNSKDRVSINDFIISKSTLFSGNTLFTIDLVAQPLVWPAGSSIPVEKEVSRQITVSTQGLTWYY